MPALNRVQLIGRLGKEPETRYTPTGKKVIRFSLAVNSHWRTSEGETKEATEWVNVEAWNRLGEICEQYLHKGSLIFLEGRLQTDHYEHQGEQRSFTKVVAQHLQMLEHRHGDVQAPEELPDAALEAALGAMEEPSLE